MSAFFNAFHNLTILQKKVLISQISQWYVFMHRQMHNIIDMNQQFYSESQTQNNDCHQ